MTFNWEGADFERVSQDVDSHGHWSPTSQGYASAEVLLAFLHQGWQLATTVTVEPYFLGGNRRSDIYHFTLANQDNFITLPVLANPVARRIIGEYQLIVKDVHGCDASFTYNINTGDTAIKRQ